MLNKKAACGFAMHNQLFSISTASSQETSMGYTSTIIFSAFCLFVGMVLFLEFGRRIGIKRMAKDPEGVRVGLGTIDGAIFGLLGLLVAFTFSGAASRFDSRRQLVIEETNVIGTAYLRIDLLPPDQQPALRKSFRQYLDSRLAAYSKLPDLEAAQADLAKSMVILNEIWPQAVAACRASDDRSAALLLLPAVNQMIDIASTHKMVAQIHPPMIIFFMLSVLALVSSLLAGYGMAGSKTHSWIHIFGFALVMAMTVFVILDIEYPRLGLIRIDAFDQALVELRQSMK